MEEEKSVQANRNHHSNYRLTSIMENVKIKLIIKTGSAIAEK